MKCAISTIAITATVIACGSAAPAPSSTTNASTVSPSEGTSNDGAVSATSATSATTTSASLPPPSGLYDVRVHVLQDTCNPMQARDGEVRGLALLVRTTKSGVEGSIPLINGLPNMPSARSDLQLKAGYEYEVAMRPNPSKCPDYKVDTVFEVESVEHRSLSLRRKISYGDAATCPGATPAGCVVETELTYALKEAKCEASCAATLNVANLAFTCTCP